MKVLITAGGAGIGRAMAEAFAAEGAEVWVTDVDAKALASCPAEWNAQHADVRDEEQMAQLAEAIRDESGGLDVVCANAGIAGPTEDVTKMPLDGWRDCVAVNLDGAFLTAKHMLPLMSRGGAITFTTSTAGLYGFPHRGPYAAAKWGVIGLMKTVAMEQGPNGIRANAIAPGPVEGPRIEGVMEREAAAKGMTRDEIYAGYVKGSSLRTFVTAQDIAQMAVFLARAPRVSGQVIAVDGHTENPDPKP